MNKPNVRDFDLPTTATTAHLPAWMVNGYSGSGTEGPACAFAGTRWKSEPGGRDRPVCRWCLRDLAEHVEWAWSIWLSATAGRVNASIGEAA